MDFNDYSGFEKHRLKEAEKKQAEDQVEKSKMTALGGLFTLATNWNDPKASMQIFGLAFNALQHISSQCQLWSLSLKENEPTDGETRRDRTTALSAGPGGMA